MTSIERHTNVDQEERIFGMLERRVNAVIKSGLVPDAIRGKPADALLVALKGHELGLTFTASFSHLFVVNGKIGESAQLLADQADLAGYDVYVANDADDTQATAHVLNRRTGQRHSLTWTIQQAQRAKLTEKPNWRDYPAAMLRARAISNAVRAFCRGIVLPTDVVLETPDELGADVVEYEVEEREQLPPAQAPPAPSGPIDVASEPAANKDSGGGDSEGTEEADASAQAVASPPSEAPAGESPNPYAEAVHILAGTLELDDNELDEILHEVTGDCSANAVTRDNRKAITDRMRDRAKAKGNAA